VKFKVINDGLFLLILGFAPQGDIDLANIQAYEFNLVGNMVKSKDLHNLYFILALLIL